MVAKVASWDLSKQNVDLTYKNDLGSNPEKPLK